MPVQPMMSWAGVWQQGTPVIPLNTQHAQHLPQSVNGWNLSTSISCSGRSNQVQKPGHTFWYHGKTFGGAKTAPAFWKILVSKTPPRNLDAAAPLLMMEIKTTQSQKDFLLQIPPNLSELYRHSHHNEPRSIWASSYLEFWWWWWFFDDEKRQGWN